MDNKMIGKRIALLRKKRGMSQEEFAKQINVSPSTVAMWEIGKREIKSSTLSELADFFNVSTDYILNRTDNPSSTNDHLPELTSKDERDIQKELQNIIDGLNDKDGFAAFGGHDISDLDEEDKELLISSLENSLRLAKRLSKQKFTPKKYKKQQ